MCEDHERATFGGDLFRTLGDATMIPEFEDAIMKNTDTINGRETKTPNGFEERVQSSEDSDEEIDLEQ